MTQEFRLAIRRLRSAPLFSASVCAALGLTSAAILAAGVLVYAILVVWFSMLASSADGSGKGRLAGAGYSEVAHAVVTCYSEVTMPKGRKKVRSAERRSACPVATTLDLVGDKWSLLIVRDMLGGKMRYGEFRESAEGIPTNVLASRLKSLEAEGLIAKKLYSQHPPRWEYELTAKGRELGNIVGDLAVWGMRHLQDVQMAKWIPKSLADQAFERYTEGGPR